MEAQKMWERYSFLLDRLGPLVSRVRPNTIGALDNQYPEDDREIKWLEKHLKELEKAVDTKRCPKCGEILEREINLLCDCGYKYGTECWWCR